MGLYLPVKRGGKVSIAACPRCKFKVYYDDLRIDPNNGNYVCSRCVDLLDPWRLSARQPEDITLTHPRPDEDLV